MQTEQWRKIEEIFNEAVNLSEDQRTFFITEKSGEDVHLRDEVLSLITEYEENEDFLVESAFTLGAQLMKQKVRKILIELELKSIG